MVVKVDLTLRIIENAKSSGAPLTPEQWDEIHRTIVALNNRVVEFETVTKRDAEITKRANVAFRRANKWPVQVTPSLAELLNWLLNRSHVEDNLELIRTLEGIAEKLDAFQSLSFEQVYQVTGGWLIDLNTRVLGVLMKHRPKSDPDEGETMIDGATNHDGNSRH